VKTASVLLDRDAMKIDENKTCDKIKEFVRNQINRSETEGVVIGMTGGIDSSVVVALCTDALGSSHVLGLLMPAQISMEEDMESAQHLGHELNILQERIDAEPFIESFKEALEIRDNIDRIPFENLISRIRMKFLYYYANSFNMLIAGTGNRSEILTGYFTKYRDREIDILPISELYRTQVRQLARFLHLPERVISKKPSADLWLGQTDEEEIGMDYETLDLILHGILDLGLSPNAVAKELDLTGDTVDNALKMIKRTEHKRTMPPLPWSK